MPDASMMNPEPSELTRRGACSRLGLSPCPRLFLKNSSKNSSNGEPGGSCGIGPTLESIVCDVEMFTTASITCSATSAMASGPRAVAGLETIDTIRAVAVSAPIAGRRIVRAKLRAKAAMRGHSPNARAAGTLPRSDTRHKDGLLHEDVSEANRAEKRLPSAPAPLSCAAHEPD